MLIQYLLIWYIKWNISTFQISVVRKRKACIQWFLCHFIAYCITHLLSASCFSVEFFLPFLHYFLNLVLQQHDRQTTTTVTKTLECFYASYNFSSIIQWPWKSFTNVNWWRPKHWHLLRSSVSFYTLWNHPDCYSGCYSDIFRAIHM